MTEFQYKLNLVLLVLPPFCAGILFAGVLSFAYLYLRRRNPLYLAMTLLGFFAFVFVGSETMIQGIGGWMHNAELGMQFHRLEQVGGAFFLFGLPLFIYHLLELNARWKRINRAVAAAGLVISAVFLVVAFTAPDLFVSVTEHKPTWLIKEGDYGRGQEGVVYALRDGLLGLFILYGIVCLAADLVWHRKVRAVLPALAGILIAVLGAADDIIHVHTQVHCLSPFPAVEYSRFTLGITIFVLLAMGGLMQQFIDLAKETEKAQEAARLEAERSGRHNEFIKTVLKSSSGTLVSSAGSMMQGLDSFALNTQNQAASTEEVSASIEEVTAGADSVARSAEEQHLRLGSLIGAIAELTRIIRGMGSDVRDALAITERVASEVKSGESSLRVMKDSMAGIGDRSKEMRGIIRIIRDISDKTNLLSLNAAIEAARAGDAGRGFAVVADEISKLADQTATSIKDIDRLIRTSENEISTGAGNVTSAVETIASVIESITSISAGMRDIAGQMAQELSFTENVNSSAGEVRTRSEEIMNAMNEQKMAIAEISKTLGTISELSQNNSTRINDMADHSKRLMKQVEYLNREIEEYREEE
jgi:methyl-accepting chemotaxis protein